MPIYEYRCTECGFQKDHLQKLSNPVLTSCPQCGQESYTKLLSAAGFQLKGSGWYATDFKGGSTSAPAAKTEAPPPCQGGDGALSVRGQLIKRYFLTGLLIWVPLVITAWVLATIVWSHVSAVVSATVPRPEPDFHHNRTVWRLQPLAVR